MDQKFVRRTCEVLYISYGLCKSLELCADCFLADEDVGVSESEDHDLSLTELAAGAYL